MKTELNYKVIRLSIVAMIFIALVTLQGVRDLRQTHQIVLMLSTISLFSLILGNIWATLFLLWTVFLYSFFKFATGGIYLSSVFFGCLLYLITKISFKKEHVDLFLNGFLWFICANIFYMAIQASGFDFIYDRIIDKYVYKHYVHNTNLNGFMGDKSILATTLSLALPVLATRKSTAGLIGTIGLFFPLYLLKTSLCFIMGLVGFLFVLYYLIPKKIWIFLIFILMILGFLYVKKVDKLGVERIPVWHHALTDAMIHPITGWGLDSFANFTPQKDFRYANGAFKMAEEKDEEGKIYRNITYIEYWDNPHNLYLSLFFEFGIVGIFIFIGYMRQLVLKYKNCIKNQNVIALAGFAFVFLGISLGHFPIFLAREACFIIPAFALLEISIS